MIKAIFLTALIALSSAQFLRRETTQLFTIDDLINFQGVPISHTNCGAESDPIKVSGVTVGATPTKGGANSITIAGTVSGHLELKEADLKVLLNGSPLHTETIPKTDVYDDGDAFNFNYSVSVPSFAPSGKYDVSFTFKKTDGSNAGCTDVTFNL